MKDELIKAMREEVRRQIANGYLLPGSSEHIIEGFTNAVLTLISREWVRVDSGVLPIKDGEYLVVVKYFTCTEVEVCTYWSEDDMWTFPSEKTCNYEITHWQPLPTPPKQ